MPAQINTHRKTKVIREQRRLARRLRGNRTVRSGDCASSRILAFSQNAEKLVAAQNMAFVKEVHDRLQSGVGN
jgi:hypothetical protein